MQRILKTPEDIDAMVGYMVINDLGKIGAIIKAIQRVAGVTEIEQDKLLLTTLKENTEISPTFQRLSARHQQLLIDGLEAKFNVGQLMQGE